MYKTRYNRIVNKTKYFRVKITSKLCLKYFFISILKAIPSLKNKNVIILGKTKYLILPYKNKTMSELWVRQNDNESKISITLELWK